MEERGKPQTTISLNVEPEINRQILVRYTLGAIERDNLLVRRLGPRREAFVDLISALILDGQIDVDRVRKEGIDPKILETKARSSLTSFRFKLGGH